jgi:DNA-binding PadR family transcriptional regulator
MLTSRWEDPEVAASEQRPRRRLYRVTAEGETAVQAIAESEKAPANALRRGLAAS